MSGMSKRAAKVLLDAGGVTWDDLRGLLERADPEHLLEDSRVNQQCSKHAVHRIYTDAIAGRAGPVQVWRPDPYRPAGSMKRTAGGMIAVNILRDFGSR